MKHLRKMAKIERFEDLKCWQQARILVNQIFALVENDRMKHEFALSDQLKRASVSVMTNIAEGFNRFHKKDFIRFLDYSQSSAQEVKSLLYVVIDRDKSDSQRAIEIQEQCDYCQALTLGLLKHAKNSLGKPKTNDPKVYYLTENHLST